MNQLKKSGWILFAIILITSCSSISDHSWSDAVPEKTPFVIIPEEDATLNSVLQSSYIPFLDDITSSANQLLSSVDSTANSSIALNAILLYPGAQNQLETVWMGKAPNNFLSLMKEHFYQDFTQNQYYFHDIVIHKLHLQNRNLFAAQLNDQLLLSESSLGIEDAIRAYLNKLPRAQLTDLSLDPGHIVLNTPSLDGWVKQLAKVAHRPVISDILKGTGPAQLSISQLGEQQNREFQLSGTIPLSDQTPSDVVAAVAGENAPISLDRYISSNAAAFGLFRSSPRLAPPASLPDTTQLDSTFMTNDTSYRKVAQTLGSEFSLVMYTKSGFLSTGEHLFLRKVSNSTALRQKLEELAEENDIERSDGIYFVRSTALAQLIGSSLCNFQDFYLDVTGDVAVISKRKGLVEMISSDRNRRRTVYYEQSFRDIKETLPSEISSLFITNNDFYSFVEPFLAPNSYLNAITSKFDIFASSTVLSEDKKSLSLKLKTYQTKDRNVPYEEQWLFPTGADLSGEAILANIRGGTQDEITFATKSGNVYVLATDGTVVMQANTGSDTPIGSPVIYDWYSTNQNVILVAAGNKIYGWNDNGELLPKFPFELEEPITTPLVVNDVNRNGLPDAIVATADRKLHVLNGRGEDLDGWPVKTNSQIKTPPTVAEYMGSNSILAFSENAINAWFADGVQKQGFPKFINSTINGSPVIYSDNILANAADGHLYSVGPNKLFADSINVLQNISSSNIQAVYASNSGLVGSPSVHNLTVSNGEQTYNEPMILTSSSNGSIFLISTSGQLRFTQNMGQPAATSFSPTVSDINKDNQSDLIALASFGRLYAWQTSNGQRIYSVPTSAMTFPIIADINSDGYQELIAQTQEGLRCWTLLGGQTD